MELFDFKIIYLLVMAIKRYGNEWSAKYEYDPLLILFTLIDINLNSQTQDTGVVYVGLNFDYQ